MKVSRKVGLAAGALAALWVAGFVFAARPAAQEQPRMRDSIVGKKAGVYFKNVSTSTLKELSVDDFIGAMGVMTDALGLDCADCHPNAGSDQVDWVFDTARKKTARRMVEMVGNLNKEFFGGAQRVTCWTCHHGRVVPATSIALNAVYEAPNSELDDFVPRDPDQPAATEILDKFVAAVGGNRWANVRNYIASGSSIGFGGFGGDGQFEIFASAPAQRTVRIQFPQHPDRGISMWVFNGTNLPGATGFSLTLTNVTLAQAGSYSAVVSTGAATTNTDAAVLTVVDLKMYAGINIAGGVGRTYNVDAQNDLNSTWLNLTNIVLPSSPFLFLDVDSPQYPRRFYRAVLAP